MSFYDWLDEQDKKKKKNAQETQKTNQKKEQQSFYEWCDDNGYTLPGGDSKEDSLLDEDIAPVKEETPWYKSGVFADGYDFGDVTKFILGVDDKKTRSRYTGIVEDRDDAEQTLSTMTSTEIAKLKRDTTTTGDRLYYDDLAVQKQVAEIEEKLSKVTLENGTTLLDELHTVANMEDGKEKKARKKALEAQMLNANVNPDMWYSMLTGDKNVTWTTAKKFAGAAFNKGLNSFNTSLTGFLDLTVGNLLKGVGWENNPVSKIDDYYEGLYETYSYDLEVAKARMGAGGWADGLGNLTESTIAAVPQALLAIASAGTSTGASLSTTAAQASGGILQSVGITVEQMLKNPQYWMSFVSTYANDYEEAKENGADDLTAGFSATITSLLNAGVEVGGGIDVLPEKLAGKGNKAITEWVKSSLEEGGEEVLQGVISNAIAKGTYDSDRQIIDPGNMLKEFGMGTAVGGVLGGGQIAASSAVNASVDAVEKYQASKLTENEQKVVNKVYEEKLAEKEKNGKLTTREKNKLYDEVVQQMERGYIDTDTIESVLGGETYEGYKALTDKETSLKKQAESLTNEINALLDKENPTIRDSERLAAARKELERVKSDLGGLDVKTAKSNLFSEVDKLTANDTRLRESYNEKIRATEDFKADLAKYKGAKYEDAAKKTIENAIKAGANNTNAVHDIVDMAANLASETGHVYSFKSNEDIKNDFVALQTKKIAKFEALENRTAEQSKLLEKLKDQLKKVQSGELIVDGNITGDDIVLNIDSDKPLNRITGHEVTHSLENAKAYEDLRNAVFAYAKSKGVDTDALIESLKLKYEGVEGASPEAELVADLVGDYLFTDSNFVNNLSTSNRNLAQRIYDEIKHLCKLATAGSKEARELERVKHAFEEAFREAEQIREDTRLNAEAEEFADVNTQYSIREKAPPKNTIEGYKVFIVKDGKLYPPMVANPEGEGTPVGVWLDADVGGLSYDADGNVQLNDRGRFKVKAGGKGTQGGGGELAFRPGWHLGEYPDASQFGRDNAEHLVTNKKGKLVPARELFPYDFVWARCEVAADNDYQLDAMSFGVNENGKFERSQAGLPYVPEDGYYKYRTNADPNTAPWIISGSIKVVEILDDEQVAKICAEHGVTPQQRQAFTAETKEDYPSTSVMKEELTKAGVDFRKSAKAAELKALYSQVFLNGETPTKAIYSPEARPGGKIDLSMFGLNSGQVTPTSEEVLNQIRQTETTAANRKAETAELLKTLPGYAKRQINFDDPNIVKEFGMNNQSVDEYRAKAEESGHGYLTDEKIYSSDTNAEESVKSLSGGAVTKYSLSTWTPEVQAKVSDNLVKAGFEKADVDKWIKDTNSIAAVIASDKARLDFEAHENHTMVKDNNEYYKTVEASTLCAKRLKYQGTFDAIQHRLPNTTLTSDMLIELREMMKKNGHEVPCGACYVESRRRHLGKYATDWLKTYNGEYIPSLADVTTTNGLENLRKEHPDTYNDFVAAMNKKGVANPKVVELRTEYKGEIMDIPESVYKKIMTIGGLRLQSFSDFETPHLLDMMQVVNDMASRKFVSQAYTKVPNFAWVLGDTNIKINLSLIPKGTGVDSNGSLIFDNSEGMDIDEAIRLRDRYSKNVGTTIIGINDAHILECMADDRIDYIIPFHRSGWGAHELSLMGMDSYVDYTKQQRERDIKTGKGVANIDEMSYWDFSKSGKENAEAYLALCAEKGVIPKFESFLVDNGDGSYSLQPDGSTDGYWKTLINFKMYDNDGIGSPHEAVVPNFNMDEAYRVLNEYEGGANSLPVANDVVEEFVAKYNDDIAPTKYSLSESDQETAEKVIEGLKTRAMSSKYLSGYATYTEERMDREIRTSSAKHNQDYAKSYITWVDPIDFIYATTTSEQVRSRLKEEAGTLDIEKLKSETQPIHLTVDFETGEIVGHEGRHRMLALQAEGIEKVAVVIDAWNDDRHHTKPIEFMQLKGQRFGQYQKGVDMFLHNMLPLSQRYADTARKLFTNKPKSGIQYSLSDSNGNELSPAVQNRFAKSKVVDYDGNLKVVYHGTPNGEFTIFDKSKGSVEGDFGSGFYFTDNADDVSRNYEGGGPDFENKIDRRAEQIEAEEDISYGEARKRAIKELYVGSNKFEVYLNIENPAIVGETTLLDYESFAEEYDREDYDSDEDYESDVEYAIADKIDEIIWEVEKNVDVYSTEGLSEVLWNAVNEGGIDVEQLKKNVNELYLEDSEGHLVGNEVTRQIIESLGYDGIIDPTVSTKFNMGLSEDTTHYIVFKPNQIKNVSNQNPTDNPDINLSMSNKGDGIAPIGNYDFYGKDFRKKSADSVAPVAETPAPVGKGTKAPINAPEEAPVDEAVKRKEVESVIGDRDSFVSKQAMELYEEITNLKKGVRASKRLGYLLDHGYEWRSIKTALLNIRDNPNQVVNPNSAAESVAREMLGREYDAMVEDFANAEGVTGNIYTKMQSLHTELENNQRLREQASVDFDSEIARLQAVYEAKKNKNTKVANDILRRIERIQRLKSTVDADYGKRIDKLGERLEKMSKPEYKTAMQRKAKQNEYTRLMENLVGDTSTWVDKKLGISYKINTLRRNLRDIVRNSNGDPDITKADAIYDELQGKYNHNEAELKRESMRIKAVFKELNLNHTEDTYAHMLGEFRHNPDSKLTEEDVKEFYEKHKNKIDSAKVDKAIEEARKTFDDLIVRVNERLREQGMKEIPYRQGYFPHFTNPKQGLLAKFFNWKPVDNEIPTSIAGLTEEFNPQRSWQTFNKQRKGNTTDYSLEQGLDTYIHGALDWIYHIEDIQKRRALENHIRYVHSEEGVKKRIDEIRNNESYDADEAQAQIDAVYAEANNPLNNFVTDLRAGTNTLANKKSSMDRKTEEMTNRKIYSVMTNLNNRINANMVVGSISSALTNFIPITQSWMEVSPVYSLKGMRDTITSTIRDDGVVNKSDFLTNRLMNEEKLYQTGWDKASEKAAIMMEAIDSFTSQTVWRSKYLQNISEGMSEVEAIKNADQFAENVIAGRSRGNQPTIFDAKNPLTKIFTAFQLEVANQYGYMFKDAPQDSKNKIRLVKGYATAFLGAYAYNALYSSLVGRDAAFDPISILEDLFKDLFGDDEEEPEEILTNLAGNVLEEVPFVGSLLGGGRIPMSSALPYSGDYESFITDIANGELSAKEMLKPVYYLAFPFGGGQIKKTNEGLGMFSDEHPVSGSYTESGNLRYPVEKTFGNVLQAGLFGQYSSKNARDYFDNNRSPLKEKQIQEYIDVDIPIRDYWDYREGLAKQKTNEDKVDYIDSLDLPLSKKNILVNNVLDRKEAVDLDGYSDFSGLDEFDFATKNPGKYAVSQVVGDYSTYTSYKDHINDLEADKDENGKSINGSKKQKVFDYIESLPLDAGQKCILFKSQYKADDSFNNEIVEYLDSREDISYEEMVKILTELGFTVNGNNVYWD